SNWHADRRRQEYVVLYAAQRMEADVRPRRGRILLGKVAPARVLRQHDRADVPVFWQHGSQQYARASVGTSVRRPVYLAGIAGSARLALDFAVGSGICLSIDSFLRRTRLCNIRMLGIVDPNGAMCNIRIIPADLSPAVSVSAIL